MKKQTQKRVIFRIGWRKIRGRILDATCLICVIILLVFPFILRLLGDHFLFVQRVIEMEALAYYGVAFGLFASFLTITIEKRKKEELERQRITPIITFDIQETADSAYVATITNRGSCFVRNIHINGDHVAADIGVGETLKINILLRDCDYDYDFADEHKTVYLLDGEGKLPRMLIVHCTDVKGQIWAHIFKRFEDCNGLYYDLREREIDGDELPILD